MAGTTILTLDVGTTACKAVLFDLDGSVAAAGEAEYPTSYPGPARAEQDPEDWWRAAVQAARRALDSAPGVDRRTVAAVGLSSQRETVALVDTSGRPLGPAISWMDRRGAEEIAELARQMGFENLHRRTGMVPDATFTLAKLLWLRRNDPDALRRAAWLLQPRDFLAARLTGEFITDPSLASRTMLWDVQAGSWWEEGLQRAGVRASQLPRVVPSHAVVGGLTPQAAGALNLPSGIPVVAGGGDRCCEALGAGLVPGEAMESTGTASNLSVVVAGLPETRDPRLAYTAHVLAGQWLVEQGLNATGALLRWLRDLAYGGPAETGAYEQMAEEASRVPPGADGLLVAPFFMGARSPRWQASARGEVGGLTLQHGRAHLARAVMEGVAFELRACLEVLAQAGLSVSQVVAMGGGARNRLWLQIKAAVLGLPYCTIRTELAASLGAMALAARATGLVDDPAQAVRRWNPRGERLQPDPSLQEAYRPVIERYERWVRAVLALYRS